MPDNSWWFNANVKLFTLLNSDYDSDHLLAFGVLFYVLLFPFVIFAMSVVLPGFGQLSNAQQKYVGVNLLKSLVLMPLACQFAFTVEHGLVPLDATQTVQWQRVKSFLRCICALYTVTDLSSTLVMRARMPSSTLLHHICVVAAYFYVRTSNMDRIGAYQCIMMFGGFSSLAFIVNTFLAYNKYHHALSTTLGDSALQQRRGFVLLCLLVYAIECMFSWIWQVYFLNTFYHNGIEHWRDYGSLCLCVFLLFHWIRDDVILMRFLFKEVFRGSS